MKHDNIEVIENKITDENWVNTPKFSTAANICNHEEKCRYRGNCRHAKPHSCVPSCTKFCFGLGRCFDISAVGASP